MEQRLLQREFIATGKHDHELSSAPQKKADDKYKIMEQYLLSRGVEIQIGKTIIPNQTFLKDFNSRSTNLIKKAHKDS